MAFITDIFAGDKALQIGAEQIVRALPFGPYWTKIRIVVTFNQTSMVLPAAGIRHLAAGVCTGSLAYHDSGCIDAIYGHCASNNPWYYAGGAIPYCYQNNGSPGYNAVYQKIGTTENVLSTVVPMNPQFSLTNSARSLVAWDFTKASASTVTGRIWGTNPISDATRSSIMTALENEGAPTSYALWNTASTGTLVRTAMDWNAMFVAYPRCVPAVNIYSISVSRFY